MQPFLPVLKLCAKALFGAFELVFPKVTTALHTCKGDLYRIGNAVRKLKCT